MTKANIFLQRLPLKINEIKFLKKQSVLPNYSVSSDCQISELGIIYTKHFEYKTNGVFVEIGAYDGETHSNTAFLADLGWKGVYVEPVSEYANKCIHRHTKNRVLTYQFAIGKNNATANLNIGGELSTTLPNPADFFTNIGFPQLVKEFSGKSIAVKQISLNSLLDLSRIKPKFDLLVLDTEGTEWNILSSFDIGKWQPRMIIVEMHEKSLDWTKSKLVSDNNKKINKYFQKAKYRKIYSDDINSIFVLKQ